MSRLIKTFTAVPKEMFRMTSVTLRDRNVKKVGRYDLLTEGGKVKPKALDPNSYAGNTVHIGFVNDGRLMRISSKWCLAAPKYKQPKSTRSWFQRL